jgi:parallel beta-helix repeat protein
MTGIGSRKIVKAITLALLILVQIPLVNVSSFVKIATAGTVWTVEPGASSIQDIINIAGDGDTILVLSGIYNEHVIIDKSLTIIGENRSNTVIDGGNAESVVKISASNVTIKELTIRHGDVGITIGANIEGATLLESNICLNTYWGIYGDRCGKAVIANNNISINGWDGIFLYASEPSVLEGNLLFSNGREGVFLRYTSNNTLKGNLIASDGVGVYIFSDDDPLRPSALAKGNIIENNRILNNLCGIKIAHEASDSRQANNAIHDNSIAYNGLGLNISGSNGNRIYHNDFIDNSAQAFINESVDNTWDNGYYDGGNYWSDYNSLDSQWGSDQNETGSDGIFDAPYIVSPNPGERDNYPFLHEDSWLAPPQLSITLPLNKTYRTERVELLFTTNKPLYLAYSLDDQPNATLSSNIVLTNMSGLSHSIALYGNDTQGNEATALIQFSITFSEDINVDGVVNILDVALVAHSYGSTPGSERWNPDVDMDSNGVINILDVAIVARAYGRRL